MDDKFKLEEGVKSLENIVKELEEGDYSIEESMELYKKGVKLLNNCNESIDKIEKEINYDFYMDVFPVTNKQYKEFIDKTNHRIPYIEEEWAEPCNWDKVRRSYPGGKEDHPVVLVSYDDAVAFCKWSSKQNEEEYRLPTEEEWEKAARGADGRKYPWGDKFDIERCNKGGYESGGTTPVACYAEGRSPFGCYDMAGNVCEWTESWYDDNNEDRVLRGSTWFDRHLFFRCSNRRGTTPDRRTNAIGFRCVTMK